MQESLLSLMRKTEGGQETSESLWVARVHTGPTQVQGCSRRITHALDPPLTRSNSGCSWRSKGHHGQDFVRHKAAHLFLGKELSQPRPPRLQETAFALGVGWSENLMSSPCADTSRRRGEGRRPSTSGVLH